MKKFAMLLALVGALLLTPAADAQQKKRCQIVGVSVFLNADGQLCVTGTVRGAFDVNGSVVVELTDGLTGLIHLGEIEADIHADGTFAAVADVDLLHLIAVHARVYVDVSVLDGRGRCCAECGDLVDLWANLNAILDALLGPPLSLLHR